MRDTYKLVTQAAIRPVCRGSFVVIALEILLILVAVLSAFLRFL